LTIIKIHIPLTKEGDLLGIKKMAPQAWRLGEEENNHVNEI
jgi:hypothetical protein